MDLFSRRIVSWEFSESMTEPLVLSSLRSAIVSRQPAAGLIHHTDRGGQYAGTRYCGVLRRAEMAQSMSGAENYYDNAFQESYFGTLKTELELDEYEDAVEAVRELSNCITYYEHRAPTFIARLPDTHRIRNQTRLPRIRDWAVNKT